VTRVRLTPLALRTLAVVQQVFAVELVDVVTRRPPARGTAGGDQIVLPGASS
jgi:hypothetical protein